MFRKAFSTVSCKPVSANLSTLCGGLAHYPALNKNLTISQNMRIFPVLKLNLSLFYLKVQLRPNLSDCCVQLSVSKQKILEVHPGVVVFTASRYKCLFTESLPLSACGFTPGHSKIDRYLASIQPGKYN